VDNLASAAPGGRNAALARAAWTLGRWLEAGALKQTAGEDGLNSPAQRKGLIADPSEGGVQSG